MEMSPSLHLLLQFQRLLVARIFSTEMAVMTKSSETKEEEDYVKPTSEIGRDEYICWIASMFVLDERLKQLWLKNG